MKVFSTLCHRLDCWVDTIEATRQCQDLLQDRHQQLALVKEAQAMGRNHPLYSVIKRYNSFKRARNAHEKAKSGLKEKIEDCEKQINMHNVRKFSFFFQYSFVIRTVVIHRKKVLLYTFKYRQRLQQIQFSAKLEMSPQKVFNFT